MASPSFATSDSPLATQKVTHADIASFADKSVNLKREDVEDYRGQVNRLRDKLDRYAADHPDYDLIKTLLSGSLANEGREGAGSRARTAQLARRAPSRGLPADEARSDQAE